MKHSSKWATIACGSIVLVLLTIQPGTTDTLLTLSQELHCAENQVQAAELITTIRNIDTFGPGLPKEAADSNNVKLNATTLDRVLLNLYQSSLKYPANKHLIESTVVQWNFCSVIDRGHFYDHEKIQETIIRTPSTAPQEWSGFRSFGLIPWLNADPGFDFTTPHTDTRVRLGVDQIMQQRYIKHCLPHPHDEHLYRSFGRNFISRIEINSDRKSPPANDQWPSECTPAEPVQLSAEEPQSTGTAEVIDESQTPAIAAANRQVATPAPTDPLTAAIEQTNHDTEPELIPETGNSEKVPGTYPKTMPQSHEYKQEQPEVENNTAMQNARVIVTAPTNATAPPDTGINKATGLSGSVSLENRAFKVENTSVKLAFSYKPKAESYWFVRSALNISGNSKPFTYSWGIGYDDWHPGTWAVQLNHWGPLRFGDGLDTPNAVAEVSYKLKDDWLDKHNLSSTIAISRPISGKPSVSWGWSWSPRPHWFVRSTLIRPAATGEINWSYGFGYARYNNKSLSFEYNNWGINKFPEHNFEKNGQLSLVYRWEY